MWSLPIPVVSIDSIRPSSILHTSAIGAGLHSNLLAALQHGIFFQFVTGAGFLLPRIPNLQDQIFRTHPMLSIF
jgi:hypothetical protein